MDEQIHLVIGLVIINNRSCLCLTLPKMYFYSSAGILLFILLQVKDILSTREICLANDITKYLDKWISSIFTIREKNAVEVMSTLGTYTPEEFEYDIGNKVDNFQTKFFFCNIALGLNYDSDQELNPPQIYWKFHENQLSVFFEELSFKIRGTIGSVKGENYAKFYADPRLKNFTLTSVASYNKHNELKISYNTSHSSFNLPEAQWEWNIERPKVEYGKQLTQEIRPALLAMLEQTLNHNRQFPPALDKIFKICENPVKEILPIHPDILSNPQKYYYLVPKIPFFCFFLKGIVFGGLSNFESYKVVHKSSGIFTQTLLIRNIRGNVTLDYRTEKETDLELSFQIGCFILSKRADTDCFYAQAKYYTVNRTKTSVSLNPSQSEVIINGLESAVASALSSSKEAGRVCNLEMPPEKIKITNCTEWKTIKASYRGWIPFSDEEVIRN